MGKSGNRRDIEVAVSGMRGLQQHRRRADTRAAGRRQQQSTMCTVYMPQMKIKRYQNHISVLNVLGPLLHLATDVATCYRGPILCKLVFGSVNTLHATPKGTRTIFRF